MENAHPFETSGLGTAPFGFLYLSRHEGGHCDHCGTAIRHRFVCQGAEGEPFTVGSDCINKVGCSTDSDHKMVSDARAAHSRAERLETEARVAAARQALADHKALFTDEPHPFRSGRTMRDELNFVLGGYSSLSTKKTAAIKIERALAARTAA